MSEILKVPKEKLVLIHRCELVDDNASYSQNRDFNLKSDILTLCSNDEKIEVDKNVIKDSAQIIRY